MIAKTLTDTKTIADRAAELGMRQVPRRLLNVTTEQGDTIDEAYRGYVRRMNAQPNVYCEMFGYVYVWRGEE